MNFRPILILLPWLMCVLPIQSKAAVDLDTISLSLKVKAYDMAISIDYNNDRMTNRCEMTIKNTADFSIQKVPFQLFRLLSVDSVIAGDGHPLVFKQTIETYRDWDKMQVDFAVVDLPQPLAAGQETTFTVYYGGYLTGYTETGMLYVQDKIDRDFTILRPDANAFPEIAVTSQKVNRRSGLPDFSYRVAVTVPKPLLVVNGGRLVSRKETDSLTTFVYENILPAWRIDIAIGDYRLLDANGINVYCFETDTLGGARILTKAQEALKLYTGWFGPLKHFESFSIIEIPNGWGSQADVTSIIQAAAAFKESSRTYELYHEISHLWNVDETDVYPPRLNEGLASFLEDLVTEKLDTVKILGRDADSMVARIQRYYKKRPEALAFSMEEFGREDLIGLSYSAGMLFYYLLYDIAGQQKFMDLQREFYDKYYTNGASSEFYAKFVSERVGKEGKLLVKDWLESNHFTKLITESSGFKALREHYR